MTTYTELLRDPRWQRKRLEVMERDNFSCVECGGADRTLNVHHLYYAKGRKPWEYETGSLQTLCEPCHRRITALGAEVHQTIGMLCAADQALVLGYARALMWLDGRWDGDSLPCGTREELVGVFHAFGLETACRSGAGLLLEIAENIQPTSVLSPAVLDRLVATGQAQLTTLTSAEPGRP